MIKSQYKTIGSPNQSRTNTKYELTIDDVHMINQIPNKQHYIVVGSRKTGKNWMSPVFYRKLPDIWKIEVDDCNLTIQLFLKTNQTNKCIAKNVIKQGYDICFLRDVDQNQNKLCKIDYKLFLKNIEPRAPRNYYSSNSNIFDSFLNANDISRVQDKQPARSKTLQTSFERVAFNGYNDYSIISQFQPNHAIQKRNFEKEIANQGKQQWKNHKQINQPQPFENDDDQKHRFQGQLNDSTSFIEHLISNMSEKQALNNTLNQENLSKVSEQNNESEEEYTTAQRWYTDKYKKKNQMRKKMNLPVQNNTPQPINNDKNMIQTTVINNDFIDKDQMLRQFSDLNTDESIPSKQIDFSVLKNGNIQSICVLSRKDDLSSSQWNTIIAFPRQGTMLVKCQSQAGQLNGCIGSEQIKKGHCSLFDNEGNNHGNFHFKCKSICNFVVQTFQMIDKNDDPPHYQEAINYQSNQRPINEPNQNNNPTNPQTSKLTNNQQENQNFTNLQNNNSIQINEDKANTKHPHNSIQQCENQMHNIMQIKHEEQQQTMNRRQQQQQLRQEQAKQAEQMMRKQKQQEEERERIKIRKQIEQQERRRQEQQRINNELQKRERMKNNVKKMQMKRFSNLQLTIEPTKFLSQSHDVGRARNLFSYDNQQASDMNENDKGYTHPMMGGLQTITKEDSPVPDRNIGTSSYTEHQLRQQLAKIPSFTLDRHEEKDESIIERDPYARLNETQMSKNSSFHKGKTINFKISSIDLNLQNPNHNGKILKMQIKNNVYYTETSKQLYFLTWKGKGYFFPSTSKNSILYLQLLQEKQGMQYSLGTCKIHLRILNTDDNNKIITWEDYIRNQSQQSIGRLTLNYQNLQKRGRSLESNASTQFKQIQTSRITKNNRTSLERINTKKKKTKQNSYRISTQVSRAQQQLLSRRDSRRINTNLGISQFNLNDSIFSRLKSRPPLTRRKYTGGNVIIPKAHRFRGQNPMLYDDPGPGSYQIASSFDRHASPL